MSTPDPKIVAIVDAIISVASTAQGAPLPDLVRLTQSIRRIADTVSRLQALIGEETGKHLPPGFRLHPEIPHLAEDGEAWTAEKWEDHIKEQGWSSLPRFAGMRGRVVWFGFGHWWRHNDGPNVLNRVIKAPKGPLYPVARIEDVPNE